MSVLSFEEIIHSDRVRSAHVIPFVSCKNETHPRRPFRGLRRELFASAKKRSSAQPNQRRRLSPLPDRSDFLLRRRAVFFGGKAGQSPAPSCGRLLYSRTVRHGARRLTCRKASDRRTCFGRLRKPGRQNKSARTPFLRFSDDRFERDRSESL